MLEVKRVRIRVVSSKEEIPELSPNETMVHITFRPSGVDLMMLMKTCPRLRAIQSPPSYVNTLSKATSLFLEIQGVEILSGDVWGHRKDINEYYTIDNDLINEIKNSVTGRESIDELVAKITNRTKLSPDMIRYIARQKMVI